MFSNPFPYCISYSCKLPAIVQFVNGPDNHIIALCYGPGASRLASSGLSLITYWHSERLLTSLPDKWFVKYYGLYTPDVGYWGG